MTRPSTLTLSGPELEEVRQLALDALVSTALDVHRNQAFKPSAIDDMGDAVNLKLMLEPPGLPWPATVDLDEAMQRILRRMARRVEQDETASLAYYEEDLTTSDLTGDRGGVEAALSWHRSRLSRAQRVLQMLD